jgi:hypothetical protein
MPDPRAMLFLINERQNQWWLEADERRGGYAKVDALPLPDEPQREASSYRARLAFRLRLLIRPSDRATR